MILSTGEMGFHLQIPSVTAICLIVTSLCVAYILSIGIYNRYWHPLAKIPGPLLGSLTEWYLVYVICSVPTFGLELHKKYGMLAFGCWRE